MYDKLKDLSTFLNDSKKQLSDAHKKDQEFREDVLQRLADLEFKYASLIIDLDPILSNLSKGE